MQPVTVWLQNQSTSTFYSYNLAMTVSIKLHKVLFVVGPKQRTVSPAYNSANATNSPPPHGIAYCVEK